MTSKSQTVAELASKTGKTLNRAPDWIKGGAIVYRICTTDDPEVLRFAEEGLAITNHLLDGSIRQIPIMHGLVGDDHPGAWNWDGLWPYWNRVTFRARDWATLHDFMQRVKEKANTTVTFHVNLTDVNAGLRDYPETREFFEKLVATGSIYRRDGHQSWPNNYIYPLGSDIHLDPPYVPREIPAEAVASIQIVALVNYKNFWESGLAKEMIDEFYGHLPYPPPLLYLDVLTLSGSNFSTGFPDGPLGGSERTQLEGVLAIADYLKSKGTDVATEGDRPMVGPRATYGWLHCHPGISADDYSNIAGATKYLPVLHVAGSTGCFAASPIASTAPGLDRVRRHYASLLTGSPGTKATPGLETCHIAYPVGAISNEKIPGLPREWSDPFQNTTIKATAEYDIPGAGDPFRGDWADLINNFYLTGIQELYHIGKGNVRTAIYQKSGLLYLTGFNLIDSTGWESIIQADECVPEDQLAAVRKSGRYLIEKPIETPFFASEGGPHQIKIRGYIPGHDHASLNVYVNGELQLTVSDIHFLAAENGGQELSLGEITLKAGDNLLAFDTGPIYMQWSDGTEAIWTTPLLHQGFRATNGDVIFADDYDRMWPDTWSGQKKIYFFSWDGTQRSWKLPLDWASTPGATLYPLTPDGRGTGIPVTITDRNVTVKLLPQVPYVLVPTGR